MILCPDFLKQFLDNSPAEPSFVLATLSCPFFQVVVTSVLETRVEVQVRVTESPYATDWGAELDRTSGGDKLVKCL